MKQYIKMIKFTIIISVFTSIAFISMDLLFSEKIRQNENEAYYVAMMTHENISYQEQELFQIFNQEFITETFDYEGQELTIFKNNKSKNISFIFGIFDAAGAWGDIIGIITLDESMSYIVNVSVLKHEEQLGKDVSTRGFLDQFINLQLDINSTTQVLIGAVGGNNLYNEVDQLAGATRTSTGFQNILNESIIIYGSFINK